MIWKKSRQKSIYNEHRARTYNADISTEKTTIRLNEFEYGGKHFKFKKQQKGEYRREGAYYFFSLEKFNIYCCAPSIRELFDEIYENVYVLWEVYVDCDESELSDSALKLRELLTRELVVE